MLDELKVRVDNFWSERIKKGDPLQQKTQTGKVVCHECPLQCSHCMRWWSIGGEGH